MHFLNKTFTNAERSIIIINEIGINQGEINIKENLHNCMSVRAILGIFLLFLFI